MLPIESVARALNAMWHSCSSRVWREWRLERHCISSALNLREPRVTETRLLLMARIFMNSRCMGAKNLPPICDSSIPATLLFSGVEDRQVFAMETVLISWQRSRRLSRNPVLARVLVLSDCASLSRDRNGSSISNASFQKPRGRSNKRVLV